MFSLNDINAKNILVIGDIMLDTYYHGDVKRISPEAPVPVFRKKSERSVPGGSANVAANLFAAGQNVKIMGILGNDKAGRSLRDMLRQWGDDTKFILTSDNRPTIEKVRFMAANNQQVLRLDIEDTTPITHEEAESLLAKLRNEINSFDIILLSDYLKGLLTYELTQGIITLANAKNIPVIIDVKDVNSAKYSGANLLKPNLDELRNMTGLKVDTDEEIISASEYLREKCNVNYVLTTCGARGMVLVGDDAPYFIPSTGSEVFDVTGAGDTAIAYLAACMANNLTMKEAVNLANIAAGVQVTKTGTSSVYWREVQEKLFASSDATAHKLISGRAVDEFRKTHANEKIVFTNGCFDILHIGHVRYLQKAAELGDILVIGLNSDKSVKRLKGEGRPINSVNERAEMLGALSFVDYVIVFEEDTPLELIKKVQPDVLVKGGDYANEYVVGTNEVEARGGKLVILPFVKGKSTTNIIERAKMS